MNDTGKKMSVEIWSDVMCPFCYIGKRRFEAALNQFQFKDDIEVIWKSFQLNPNMVTNTNVSVTESLAKSKGWTVEYAREMGNYVTNMAAGVGLKFNFDKAVVANSFNAHRLLQFAKTKGKGDALKELLLKAYFEEGKNTDDTEILTQLGVMVGLFRDEVLLVLSDKNSFAEAVRKDVQQSKELGINGVPFFSINKKLGISGAQETSTFLQALNKAHKEWTPSKPTFSL
jgi:predicted DsbA family dithiol-disulfide isomerase